MQRIPVESSNIKAVGFDADTSTLEVQFTNGGTYVYAPVPLRVFGELLAAESKGSYLASQIKPRYTAVKQPAEKGLFCFGCGEQAPTTLCTLRVVEYGEDLGETAAVLCAVCALSRPTASRDNEYGGMDVTLHPPTSGQQESPA